MKKQKPHEAIIIFAKNPVLGKVKTRLAEGIGEEKALDVYKQLLKHTHQVVNHLSFDKYVYYSSYLEENDIWSDGNFLKKVQQGEGLGTRMLNAFNACFDSGYTKVCIIGTDCFDIDSALIKQAFDALNTNDYAIGPATDGGYYLLGMKTLTSELFTNKIYSTSSVFDEAVSEINRLNKTHHVLPVLSDIDYVEDLNKINE